MYHDVTPKSDEESPSPPLDESDASGSSRKERVLHTRVPAVLERELKRFADNLRIPVSNLVRTILEDAVNVADAAGDRVEERLKSAAHRLEHERDRLKKRVQVPPLADVYAYQTVTVAQPAACARCGTDLAPGTRAHLGLSDAETSEGKARPRTFVCDRCLPKA
jgi:hypothetical protein